MDVSGNVADYDESDTLIGRGVSGQVYLSKDKEGKKVAIKVLEKDGEEEVEKEVEQIMKFQHDNIIKVFAHGIREWNGLKNRYVIVMEWCSEGSLSDMLRKNFQNGLDDSRFLLLMDCLRNSLKCFRDAGILHRDIKPLNICCHRLPNGELIFKMIDFGVAAQMQKHMTKHKLFVGTVLYLHPRILRIFNRNDDSVINSETDLGYIDLWSIGTTLFEAATGHRAIQPKDVPRSYEFYQSLNRAYDAMEPEVICMKEVTIGKWEQYKDYPEPEKIILSKCLANSVRPMITYLMTKDKNQAWKVEDFLKECDSILNGYDGVVRTFQSSAVQIRELEIELESLKNEAANLKVKENHLQTQLDDVTQTVKQTHIFLEEKVRCLESYIRQLEDQQVVNQVVVEAEAPPTGVRSRWNLKAILFDINWYLEINWEQLGIMINWFKKWENIMKRMSTVCLSSPPVILPNRFQSWIIEFTIKWDNGLKLFGEIMDIPQNRSFLAESIEIPFLVELSLGGGFAPFRTSRTFSLRRNRTCLWTISSNTNDLWPIPKLALTVIHQARF